MNKLIAILAVLGTGLVACNGGDGGTGFSADAVVLDVRCAAAADCPAAFECENETEHGVSTSFCVAHAGDGAVAGQCPAGYELETEHESTFCKPHGGDGGGGGDDGSGGHGGDGAGDGGAGGTATEGQACQSDADCAAGLECEIETENGTTTSLCKAHGGS